MFKKLMTFTTVAGLLAASQITVAAVMADNSASAPVPSDQVGGVTIQPAQATPQLPKKYQATQQPGSRHESMTTPDANAPQYKLKTPAPGQNTAPRHAALTTHTATMAAAPVAQSASKPASANMPQPSFARNVPNHTPATLVSNEQAGMGYYFTSDDYHPYVGVKSGYTHFSLSDYGMASSGTTGIQSRPLAKSSPRLNVIFPVLYAGYHFENHFIPMLFGQHANLEMSFAWYNRGYSDRKNSMPDGAVWKINGSGQIGTLQPNKVALRNYHYSNNLAYKNFSLLFKGDRGSSNPHLSINPFFGLVYTKFDQDFKSSVEYADNPTPLPPESVWSKDSIKGTNDTYYIGPEFGANLAYHFTQHIDALVNLDLQLLYASTNLKESQVPINGGNTTIKVKNDNSKLTYRGLFSVETRYNFTVSPASPSLGLVLGLDKWGYVGEVRNPRGSAETKKARILNTSQNNPYAMIDLRLPLTM